MSLLVGSLFESILDKFVPAFLTVFDTVTVLVTNKKVGMLFIASVKLIIALIFLLYISYRLFILRKPHMKSDIRIDFVISLLVVLVLTISVILLTRDYLKESNKTVEEERKRVPVTTTKK